MRVPNIPGYTIIRPLARGGISELFVARNERQERVVLRILDSAHVRRASLRTAFLRTAKILESLRHPHIVSVFATGIHNHTPYMVMEFVDGYSLRELINRRDPWLSRFALDLIRQLAETLLYIHNHGYLHLDVKPDNILVRPNAQLVLTDFDLAIPRPRRPKRIRELPGTPAYAAPELLTHRLVAETSDVYSFGVTAYEMLTFHKPFERYDPRTVYQAQVDESIPPTPPSVYNPHLPLALERILFKCLAKNLTDRYPSMSIIIKDLRMLT